MYGAVWAFLVSTGCITLIKGSSFGSETWLITQDLKPGERCVIEKLSSPFNKENGSIVINKDVCFKLSWDHKHVLVLDFLDHGLTLPADCYCGTLSLWWPFFFCCKWPRLLGQIIVLLHEIAKHHTPNWAAVYGCTSDRLWVSPSLVLSVLFLPESLRSTWLATDCNRCRCEASYHPLGYRHSKAVSLPWNISLGTIMGQIPRW